MKKNNKIVFFAILLLFCIFIAYGITQCSGGAKDQNKNVSTEVNFVPFPENLKKYEVYPWEIIKLADFNKSYKEIVGSKYKEYWIRSLNGPSTINKMLMTPQGNCIVVYSCKPHDCSAHLLIILFNPENSYCWAMTIEEERVYWFGKPDNGMKELMRKIGKTIWPTIAPGIFDQN